MSYQRPFFSGGFALAVTTASSMAVAGFGADGNVYLRSHEIQREQSGDSLLSPFADVDRDHEAQGHLNTHWEITPYRLLDTQWAVAHRRTDLGDPRKGSRLSRASLRY